MIPICAGIAKAAADLESAFDTRPTAAKVRDPAVLLVWALCGKASAPTASVKVRGTATWGSMPRQLSVRMGGPGGSKTFSVTVRCAVLFR